MKYILFFLICSTAVASEFSTTKSYSKTFSSTSKHHANSNMTQRRNEFNQKFSHGNVSLGLSFSTGMLNEPRELGITKEAAFILKLRDLQKSGNKTGLQQEIQKLQQARIMIGRNAKIAVVNTILQEPITEIFDVIKHGSSDQAQAAVQRLLTLSPYKYRFGRDECPDVFAYKQALYQQKYMYDVLEEAKKLYESRADAPPILGCPVRIGFYTIQPSDISINQEDHAFDLMTTLPSQAISISPEVDTAIAHRISYMHESELKNIDALSCEAGATLYDIIDSALLSKDGSCINRDALEKFYVLSSKITQEDIPYFCMRCAKAFKDRVTDPASIVIDQVKGTYAVAKFFFDLNFGRYYMTDKEAIEHYLEPSIKAYVAIINGFEKISADNVADCIGTIAADLTCIYGAGKMISYLKEVGAVKNKTVQQAIESLEIAKAEPENPLLATEETMITPAKQAASQLEHRQAKIAESVPTVSEGMQTTKVNAPESIVAEHNTYIPAKEELRITSGLKDQTSIQVNKSAQAVLIDGYYEVNGFKFSKYYYERLWESGRPAPALIAQEILNTAKCATPDLKKIGFMRYEVAGWEMIYNPITKEIWHLSPIKG